MPGVVVALVGKRVAGSEAVKAGGVEEPEPPQMVAVVAAPPEAPPQVGRVGRQHRVARRLGQEIHDRVGLLDQVHPRTSVAEALRPLVRTHYTCVPTPAPAQERPHRLGVLLAFQTLQVGGGDQRQVAAAGVVPRVGHPRARAMGRRTRHG